MNSLSKLVSADIVTKESSITVYTPHLNHILGKDNNIKKIHNRHDLFIKLKLLIDGDAFQDIRVMIETTNGDMIENVLLDTGRVMSENGFYFNLDGRGINSITVFMVSGFSEICKSHIELLYSYEYRVAK